MSTNEPAKSTAVSYPPNVSEAECDNLVAVVKDWGIAHGLAVRPPATVIASDLDPVGILATNVAVTLFPSPFPKVCFEEANGIQKAYSQLYAAISEDVDFLDGIVKEVAGDDFIERLWNIHLKVKEEGYTQDLSLGLFRSDYMVHEDPSTPGNAPQIKQVEFNTIASSFGGLSAPTSSLHRFLADTEYPYLDNATSYGSLDLPANNSPAGLARGVLAAFDAYGPSELNLPRCVLFVVQAGERNIFDQRHLEYAIKAASRPPVPVFRIAFRDILEHTTVAATARRQLLYQAPQHRGKRFEVSVVYLRAGYGPADYPDDAAWDARTQLERSAAIKCPTVLTQLAGTKKVQQVLATPSDDAAAAAGAPSSSPSILSRFVPSADTTAALRRTFAAIHPLDASTPAGQAARRLALDPDSCRRYVLKPQREGGGNNVYRSAIPDHLRSVPERSWGGFILMELITPPPVRNAILRNGKVEVGGVICELGVYGTCLWRAAAPPGGTAGAPEPPELLHNEVAGYLLRTKGDQSEEGGVAAGFGCMDSCALV